MEHPSSVGSSTLSPTDWSLIEGTKENPYKVQVMRSCPEKNSAKVPFVRLTKYLHEGFRHDVWEFETSMPVYDFNYWEAYADSSRPNCILVKGPTKTHYEKAAVLCNPDCHDVNDPVAYPFPVSDSIKDEHDTLDLAIGKEPNRQYSWWEYEIEGAVLDNNILSGPSGIVTKEPRKLKSQDEGNQKGFVAVWRIAEAGGMQAAELNTKSVKDVMAM